MIASVEGLTYSFFLPNKKVKWQVVTIASVVVFLIMFLLQPFGQITHGFTLKGIFRIASYALATGMTLCIGEFYLVNWFRFLFTGKQFYLPIIWYGFEIFLASSLVFVCKNAWSYFDYWSWPEYMIVLQRSASIAVFPLMLLFLFLVGRKRKSNAINLHSVHKNEFLQINRNELIFLQSADNYTNVFYLQNEDVKKKILRGSLSSFDEQLKFPMIRCHRSYIVNLEHIKSLKGNSQGYWIELKDWSERIKVSRKYKPGFDASWKSYRDDAL